jgi:protein-arginine kinase activator protein McsA
LAEYRVSLTEMQVLEKRLRQAVAEEAYEEAARLRDRLHDLRED